MFQEYLSSGIFRQGLLQDGVFTLWTPMVGGGYPIFAHPHEASFVFPFWPAILAFGEVVGVRLNILFIFITGVVGMYFLAGLLPSIGRSHHAKWFATLVYAACPIFVETVTSGNFNELMSFLVPAIAYAGLRGMSSRRWFVVAAMLIAFIAFFGKYSFVYVMLLVAIAALWAWSRIPASSTIRRPMVARILLLGLLAVGIASIKLIPMVELIMASEYQVEGAGLHALRPKYFLPIVWFIMALVLSRLVARHGLWLRASFRVIVVSVILSLWLLNIGQMAMAIDHAPLPEREMSSGYHQIQGVGLTKDGMRTPNSNGYLNFVKGVATLDWFDDWISIPTRVVPKYFVNHRDVFFANQAYAGEAWLRDSSAGRVLSVQARANRIDAVIELERPTVLELNWNFHEGWRSQSEIRNNDGLIAVEGLNSGITTVSLCFFPSSLILGLLVMLASLTFSLLLRPIREGWLTPESQSP